MTWENAGNGCRLVTVTHIESPDFLKELIGFWRKFSEGIIPQNKHLGWEYIEIHLESANGRFTCYPNIEMIDSIEAWASVKIDNLYQTVMDIPDDENFDKIVDAMDARIAKVILEAAALAQLDELCDEKVISVKIYRYDNDEVFAEKEIASHF